MTHFFLPLFCDLHNNTVIVRGQGYEYLEKDNTRFRSTPPPLRMPGGGPQAGWVIGAKEKALGSSSNLSPDCADNECFPREDTTAASEQSLFCLHLQTRAESAGLRRHNCVPVSSAVSSSIAVAEADSILFPALSCANSYGSRMWSWCSSPRPNSCLLLE